jgi:8-oxo-dGTP diphosphatase
MRPICTYCGLVVFVDPKVVAGVITSIDGMIVMVRRGIEPGIGKWTFPAGYVDRGESASTAAIREMEEETCLKVRLNRLIGVYSDTGEVIILIVYSGEIIDGILKAGSDAQEAGLFDIDNLPPLAFKRDKIIMDDWMRLIRE